MRIVRYDDGREFMREKDLALLIEAEQSFTIYEIDSMKTCMIELENELGENDISYTIYNKIRFFNLYSAMYALHVLALWFFLNIYFVYLLPLGLYVGLISGVLALLILVPVSMLHMKVFCNARCEVIKNHSDRRIEVLFKK